MNAMIKEPHVVAELPEALGSGGGRSLAANIYSLVGGRKRKRSELALALDNQSVNLYDVS